jgi:hypothetical protein
VVGGGRAAGPVIGGDVPLLDVIYVLATLAFFVLTALIGRGLERIGTDIPVPAGPTRQSGDGPVPATAAQIDGVRR